MRNLFVLHCYCYYFVGDKLGNSITTPYFANRPFSVGYHVTWIPNCLGAKCTCQSTLHNCYRLPQECLVSVYGARSLSLMGLSVE